MTSGVSKDRAQNVWHFIADNLTALDLALVQLTTFYAAVDGTFSNLVATTGHQLKCYDLADLEPRAPVRDQGIGTLSVGGAPLPTELAICISFQGPRQSGVEQARRRGRLYLGPMASANVATDGRVISGAMTVIGGALQNMLDASQAAATWAWAVYSRKNEAAIEVTNAWIDNEWDVQRRRGREATQRDLKV
jgi:hypothetical protein